MRIGVFDFVLNKGGGVRFSTNLMLSWKRLQPDIVVDFYCDVDVLARIVDIGLFKQNGISIVDFKLNYLPRPNLFQRAMLKVVRKFNRNIDADRKKQGITRNLKKIYALSGKYDVAFFPWPFLIPNIETQCPKFATFHDFNFKYFFGLHVFSLSQSADLDKSVEAWLADTNAIVSTEFMRNELIKFFPKSAEPSVIHLAPFTDVAIKQAKPGKSFDERMRYIIYPTHLTVHKNLGPLISALYLINKRGYGLRLYFTGAGTETVRGIAAEFGLERTEKDADVIGLGYVTDEEINFLISRAAVVVSTSLYEAGCGPALDAWSLGTPVAMSKIPAFEEHIIKQGVKAQLFNPRDPRDIAEKIMYLLDNPTVARQMANESLTAIAANTWQLTGRKYLDTFRNKIRQ